MSDMMMRGGAPGGRPPMGGGGRPPMGGAPGGGGAIKDNLSVFNPADLAMTKAQGNIDPNMKVSDYLRQVGIDPEGPLTQLAEFGKKQMQNGDILGKMNNIAGGPGGAPGGAPPPMPGGGATGGTPGMEDLLSSL